MMTGQKKRMSDETAQLVDSEQSRIIDEEYARARKILEDNSDKVEAMTKALIEWETIDSSQVAEIMEGKDPTPPEDLPTPKNDKGNGSGDDKSDKPSVKPQFDNPASDA